MSRETLCVRNPLLRVTSRYFALLDVTSRYFLARFKRRHEIFLALGRPRSVYSLTNARPHPRGSLDAGCRHPPLAATSTVMVRRALRALLLLLVFLATCGNAFVNVERFAMKYVKVDTGFETATVQEGGARWRGICLRRGGGVEVGGDGELLRLDHGDGGAPHANAGRRRHHVGSCAWVASRATFGAFFVVSCTLLSRACGQSRTSFGPHAART